MDLLRDFELQGDSNPCAVALNDAVLSFQHWLAEIRLDDQSAVSRDEYDSHLSITDSFGLRDVVQSACEVWNTLLGDDGDSGLTCFSSMP